MIPVERHRRSQSHPNPMQADGIMFAHLEQGVQGRTAPKEILVMHFHPAKLGQTFQYLTVMRGPQPDTGGAWQGMCCGLGHYMAFRVPPAIFSQVPLGTATKSIGSLFLVA